MALIKCPECGREISDKATTCPHCGCPVEVQDSSLLAEKDEPISSKQLNLQPQKETKIPSKKNNMMAITIIICFVLFAFCISKCNKNKLATQASETTTTVVDTANVKEVEEPKVENWTYSQQYDEMSEKTSYFAQCTSTNSEQFEFPYTDPCYMSIVVRQSPKYGKDVYVSITTGQFNVKFQGTPVKFKFDDGAAETYGFNSADDGSHDVLFSNNPKRLIAKLKNSKTLKIEAEFFKEGSRIFRFNTEGLVWEH